MTQAPSDWWSTTRQTLPGFLRLLGKLRPTVHLPGAGMIDESFLERHGIEGLLWDVDGTLMPHHHMAMAEELRSAVHHLIHSGKFKHAVVSNCGESRFAELGRIFPEVPAIKGYSGQNGPVFRVLHRGEERWLQDHHPISPVSGLRPLKKPSGELLHFAAEAIGVPPDRAVMVGDQYFTDIAGANLAGMRSIKVPTLGRSSFPWPIRVFQRIEALLYRLLYSHDR